MRGGWVGSDVSDKVPNKSVFFDTFPKSILWKYESGVDAFFYKSKTYTQKDAINVYTTSINLRKRGEKLKKYAEYRIQGVA